jgi:hypothetical protein
VSSVDGLSAGQDWGAAKKRHADARRKRTDLRVVDAEGLSEAFSQQWALLRALCRREHVEALVPSCTRQFASETAGLLARKTCASRLPRLLLTGPVGDGRRQRTVHEKEEHLRTTNAKMIGKPFLYGTFTAWTNVVPVSSTVLFDSSSIS